METAKIVESSADAQQAIKTDIVSQNETLQQRLALRRQKTNMNASVVSKRDNSSDSQSTSQSTGGLQLKRKPSSQANKSDSSSVNKSFGSSAGNNKAHKFCDALYSSTVAAPGWEKDLVESAEELNQIAQLSLKENTFAKIQATLLPSKSSDSPTKLAQTGSFRSQSLKWKNLTVPAEVLDLIQQTVESLQSLAAEREEQLSLEREAHYERKQKACADVKRKYSLKIALLQKSNSDTAQLEERLAAESKAMEQEMKGAFEAAKVQCKSEFDRRAGQVALEPS